MNILGWIVVGTLLALACAAAVWIVALSLVVRAESDRDEHEDGGP